MSAQVDEVATGWRRWYDQYVASEREVPSEREARQPLTFPKRLSPNLAETAKFMQKQKNTKVTHNHRPCTGISILAPAGSYA